MLITKFCKAWQAVYQGRRDVVVIPRLALDVMVGVVRSLGCRVPTTEDELLEIKSYIRKYLYNISVYSEVPL